MRMLIMTPERETRARNQAGKRKMCTRRVRYASATHAEPISEQFTLFLCSKIIALNIAKKFDKSRTGMLKNVCTVGHYNGAYIRFIIHLSNNSKSQ